MRMKIMKNKFYTDFDFERLKPTHCLTNNVTQEKLGLESLTHNIGNRSNEVYYEQLFKKRISLRSP